MSENNKRKYLLWGAAIGASVTGVAALAFSVASAPPAPPCTDDEIQSSIYPFGRVQYEDDRLYECRNTQAGHDAYLVDHARRADHILVRYAMRQASKDGIDWALIQTVYFPKTCSYEPNKSAARAAAEVKVNKTVQELGPRASQLALDTALGWAVIRGYPKVADTLISYGADETITNDPHVQNREDDYFGYRMCIRITPKDPEKFKRLERSIPYPFRR